MTPENAWIYAVLPFLTMAVLTAGLVIVFRQRASARRSRERPAGARGAGPARPWWGNPWLWIVGCLVSILLGFFVWPWLFGFTLVFLPFVWIRRPRRERQMDPKTNGHSARFTPEP
jgi:hypothetical protein